jgi:mRNA interferase RelE/StbE
MIYLVKISESAQKYLKSLSTKSRRIIGQKIDNLSENPRPHGFEPLKGSSEYFRIRSGIYRIIYTIQDDILTVTVVRIDKRDKIYKVVERLHK